MSANTAKPYELECGHTAWFKNAHAPSPGDPVYCVKCNQPTTVESHNHVRGTFYPDSEWMCFKVTDKTSKGVCWKDGVGCGYEYKAPFRQLRARMDRHALRGCDRDRELLEIKVITLPPNSPPPF